MAYKTYREYKVHGKKTYAWLFGLWHPEFHERVTLIAENKKQAIRKARKLGFETINIKRIGKVV